VKRETLERLLADRRAERPVVLVTDLASGEQRLLRPGAEDADPGLVAAAEAALLRDEAQRFEGEVGAFFLQPFAPPLRLIVVGAVHIAQPLAAMAALAGWAVVIVDPRQAFASEARFPGVTLATEWPDAAVARLAPDSRTALVTLTHDPKLDDPALAAALRSPACYVGALGSKKTHAARLERLRALGLGEAELARIHAPVGLDLGARSPAEIALSILAELTLTLRGARR
jgi:xanthine dehydrogenase accessory factor